MKYDLDDRHLNILVHLAESKDTKEIAQLTCFSERTVKKDISTLFVVFDVKSRAGLVAKALREGVIE